ncbi:MAG TPA: hypothetical protein VFT22_07745, partial [Kofleriaceae bacterium]|nr:hypothetical protein [Kofleriaceae bacterium]
MGRCNCRQWGDVIDAGHQAIEPGGVVEDHREEAIAGERIVARAVAQQLRRAADPGQRRLELVADVA